MQYNQTQILQWTLITSCEKQNQEEKSSRQNDKQIKAKYMAKIYLEFITFWALYVPYLIYLPNNKRSTIGKRRSNGNYC